MYLFNNLLVFYFSYALIFFSIVGNGFFVSKFINYNDDNIFINFFLALPFLLLLGFSSYYLIGVNIIFNIVEIKIIHGPIFIELAIMIMLYYMILV